METVPIGINSSLVLTNKWSPFLRFGPSVFDVNGVVADEKRLTEALLVELAVRVQPVTSMQYASYSSSKIEALLIALILDLSKFRMDLLLLLSVMRFPAVRYEGTLVPLGL